MAEYVIISNLIVSKEEASKHREDHIEFLMRLKDSGKLSAAGGFADGEGGMYIISVDSDAEAEEIAKHDPYNKRGVRKYEVRRWNRAL